LDIESHILVSHPNNKWRGEVGRATDILEKLQDVCKNSILVACGPSPMFLTVEKIVKLMPIATKNIFFP
jgi:NAD(P)H-flavin reductase